MKVDMIQSVIEVLVSAITSLQDNHPVIILNDTAWFFAVKLITEGFTALL